MSMGSKIAQARKDAGLSQEELARMLSVEWESLSRWESGIELPGEKYIPLLQVILGISLEQEPPKEEISFVHKPGELGQLGREIRDLKEAGVRGVMIGLAIVAALMPLLSGAFIGTLLILAFIAVVFLIKKARFNKMWKSNRQALAESTYSLRIFDDRFEWTRRRGETETRQRVDFGELRFAKAGALYTVFQSPKGFYSIPKSALVNSAILSRLAEDRKEKLRRERKMLALHMALYLASIAAVSVLYMVNFGDMPGAMGLGPGIAALAAAVIPVAAIVVGLRRDYGTGAKVLLTIFSSGCAITLLIFGILSLALGSVSGGGDEVLDQVEHACGISVPEPISYEIIVPKKGVNDGKSLRDLETWTFRFDATDARNFESQLKNSEYWKTRWTEDLLAIAGDEVLCAGCDYLMVLEPESGRINSRPATAGTYTFLAASYDGDTGTLCVVIYELDYSISEKTEVM